MKNDKRLAILKMNNQESKRYTRETIELALVYLMQKKDIDDITITDITNKAMVSRTAYYHNYASKEDVLISFAKNVIDLLNDSMKDEKYSLDHLAFFSFLLNHIKNNKEVFKLLLKGRIANFGINPIVDLSKLNEDELYQVIALRDGFNAIISHWIRNDCLFPVEELALICVNSFPQIDLILK